MAQASLLHITNRHLASKYPTHTSSTTSVVSKIASRSSRSFLHHKNFPQLPVLIQISTKPISKHSTCITAQAASYAAPMENSNGVLAIKEPNPYLRLASPWDREIFALAIPALFSTLLDPLMGMVDTAIVGRLGTEPLAAVGLSTVIYNFSNFIWNFLLYTTTPRIAAAASKNDPNAISKITSQGLWVATAIGCTMTTILWINCPAMFVSMGGSPAVLEHAVPYLRGRCIASPAIMMFYVLAGTFRGFKDTVILLQYAPLCPSQTLNPTSSTSMYTTTHRIDCCRTPLTAGIISNIFHLFLDVAFVFWLQWGVTGAALATSLSHWVTLLILGSRVVNKGYLKLSDLRTPPSWSDVSPVLRNGLLLSTRSLLAMSMLMWATKLIAGFGAVALAAHEILRQIWVFSNQAFTSLDIATQSLVAFYLGRGDRASAADLFKRTISLTFAIAVVIMFGLLAGEKALPAIFTKDVAVVAQVSLLMPLISVFMPLDAMASAMDGVLLGSQEAAWMSRTMIATSACCAAGLLVCQNMGYGIFAVWSVIKFLTMGRLIGNAWRLWSPQSPLGEYIWSSRSVGVHSHAMAGNNANGSMGPGEAMRSAAAGDEGKATEENEEMAAGNESENATATAPLAAGATNAKE